MWQQRGTEQLPFALAHVVGQPVVVRAALCVCVADVGVGLDAEELGGIEHRHVDVVGAHVLEARFGVVRGGTDLGVTELAVHRALAVLVAHARGTRDGGGVGRAAVAVPEQPLGAVGVGLDVPDAIAVLLWRVVEHAGRVLEDVSVGVDEAELTLRRHDYPLGFPSARHAVRETDRSAATVPSRSRAPHERTVYSARMTQTSDATRALFTSAAADDPHPVYRRLREECPVARRNGESRGEVYLNTYEDIFWAMRHPEYFTSEDMDLYLGEQPQIPLEVDPPEHTKYRRLLNPQFVPREIEKLEPEVRGTVRELIDGFAARGSCDFHEELATPLPSSIFLPLMGLPRKDLPTFLQWRDDNIRPDVEPGDFEGAERIRRRASHEMNDYFRAAIALRRDEPNDGLLSQIVQWKIDGEPLSERELLGMCHLLLIGGLDTVTATLDCMIAFLATHPEHRREIVDHPDRIPAAVEEMLRWLTPVMVVPRSIAQDVELRGVQLKAGDSVQLVLGSANDDEDEFGPSAVDFSRDPNRHLAFGGSHHLCLGAHLARLELRVALDEFHRRIPDYTIADGAEIHYSLGIRQAEHLPLVFDPA